MTSFQILREISTREDKRKVCASKYRKDLALFHGYIWQNTWMQYCSHSRIYSFLRHGIPEFTKSGCPINYALPLRIQVPRILRRVKMQEPTKTKFNASK